MANLQLTEEQVERIKKALIQDIEAEEQAERIKEALADYQENPEDYTLEDFEDIFEDRDPMEFL